MIRDKMCECLTEILGLPRCQRQLALPKALPAKELSLNHSRKKKANLDL